MRVFIYILLLCSLFCKSQNLDQQKLNDAKHFYASVGLCESTYHLQGLMFRDQKPHNRFFVSILTSLSFGVSKELFDKYRCNRSKKTGFDKMDLFTDAWGVTCWIPFRICLNDYNKNKLQIIKNQKHGT